MKKNLIIYCVGQGTKSDSKAQPKTTESLVNLQAITKLLLLKTNKQRQKILFQKHILFHQMHLLLKNNYYELRQDRLIYSCCNTLVFWVN